MKIQDMKTLAINDIKYPVRLTVDSKHQLLQTIRGAHNIKDALEITIKDVGFTYHICEMTHINASVRKEILSRAAAILVHNTPASFYEKVKDNSAIPRWAFMITSNKDKGLHTYLGSSDIGRAHRDSAAIGNSNYRRVSDDEVVSGYTAE